VTGDKNWRGVRPGPHPHPSPPLEGEGTFKDALTVTGSLVIRLLVTVTRRSSPGKSATMRSQVTKAQCAAALHTLKRVSSNRFEHSRLRNFYAMVFGRSMARWATAGT
jgi:hypothetical protein